MNENDSEILAGILEKKGFVLSGSLENADLVITNTCSVRDGAERKAKGFISGLSALKKKNPRLKIAVVGCMAERLGAAMLKKYPFVDIILGPNKESEIEKALESAGLSTEKFTSTGDAPGFRDSLSS